MKYTFCTLATGEKYTTSALKFAEDLYESCNNYQMLIVADNINYTANNKTTLVKLPQQHSLRVANNYNYNLKYYPIQLAAQTNSDVVIFVDADWRIHKEFNEDKINSLIKWILDSPYDFLYERSHKIGDSKINLSGCFWRHKIEPYKLLQTNKYDEANVCNEQFLVFKNNTKLKIFANAWEERCKFTSLNNIWTFAEGVEIGMSSIDACMVSTWFDFYLIRSCFEFTSASGKEYIKF